MTASKRPSAGNGLPGCRIPGRRRGSPRYNADKAQPWRVALPRSCFRLAHGPGYAGQPRATAHVCPHHTSQRPPRRTGRCKRSAPTVLRGQPLRASPPVGKRRGKGWSRAARTTVCQAECRPGPGPRAYSHTEFMAIGRHWALLQGPGLKIATTKHSNTFTQFGQGPEFLRRNTFGASEGQSARHDIGGRAGVPHRCRAKAAQKVDQKVHGVPPRWASIVPNGTSHPVGRTKSQSLPAPSPLQCANPRPKREGR